MSSFTSPALSQNPPEATHAGRFPQLRQGRRQARHVYWQDAPEPTDDDPYVCTAETAELAAEIVAAMLDLHPLGIPASLRPR